MTFSELLENTTSKAELLQLKPHPYICMRNFINKKVGNRKKQAQFLKVEY